MRRFLRAAAVAAVIIACALAIPALRHKLLRSAGQVLVTSDEAGPADLLVMDVESGSAGVLALSDLHRDRKSVV